LVIALFFTVSAAIAQRSETRTPGTFTQIESGGSWDVEITKGSKDEVRLEANSFDLSRVITELDGERLEIKLEKGNWKNVDLKVYITVRELESVGTSGSGDMQLRSDFGARNFSIGLSGSGSLSTRKINAEKLDIGMSGSGRVTIEGGRAESASIGQSGSGNLEAIDFVAGTAEIGKSGSGTTSIGVTDALTVAASGSGNVYYRGDPENKRVSASGSAKVIKQ